MFLLYVHEIIFDISIPPKPLRLVYLEGGTTMTKEEITQEVQNYLERKFRNCEFYEDRDILDDLNSIVDKAYEDIWEILEDAEKSIDYEIETWNQNYREGARQAYLQAIKDDMRTQDELEKDLF